MIIYNVTIQVEESIEKAWLQWMKEKHLADVLGTGMFTDYKMLKLLSLQEDETGITYAIQYRSKNMENYERYQEEFAPALQAEGRELFGDKFIAFRTLLEEVEI
ncbi:MAG: DUF4286 family protein [Bacteroidia bacterium]|nr:DUF4286 family protein [Bacteroidia bacterium]